jgi:hypothetical protein
MRAVVVECHGRSSRVIFVDSGDEGEVEEIKIADPELVSSLKAQAIECNLHGLEIEKQAASLFKPLINGKVRLNVILRTVVE